MQDIHDIKPPVQVGIDPFIIKLVLGILAIVIIVIFGYILFCYFKKKMVQKNSNILFLPPPIPADQAALLELNSLGDLMTRDPRTYYFKITAILKTFIGKTFKINAPEMTTQEIISSLNRLEIEKKLLTTAKKFFLSSSMVKYAKFIPYIDRIQKDEQFLRSFIEKISTNMDTEPANDQKTMESKIKNV